MAEIGARAAGDVEPGGKRAALDLDGLVFSVDEYRERIGRARADLAKRGLDALLCFAQDSLYYLTGYDGTGFVFFQCMVLTAAEAPMTLLCRRPDVAQARDTSLIDEIRVWLDAEGADPAMELRKILEEKGLQGTRIGIELNTYGLTGWNLWRVQSALDGFCELSDASDVVARRRLVKSPSEIACIRRAGELADLAFDKARTVSRPGIVSGEIAAEISATILRNGGDAPPGGPLVNSGAQAVYGRGVGGTRKLAERDLVVVEYAGTYRRYNCCIERSIAIGPPSPAQVRLHGIVQDTLLEMQELFRKGRRLGEVDDVHRARLDEAGHGDHRFAACGYSLGATYRPSWMDVPPMIYSGNPLVLEPGMVFFPHVMVGDTATRLAIGLGNTVRVTEGAPEILTNSPLDLTIA
jgi:Xaa-Pro dipeptidase